MARGQGNYVEEILVPSAERTANGDSGVLDGYGPASSLRLQLDVTSVGATPSLAVVVEDTLDGTNWNALATFATRTAVGREVLNVTSPFAARLRVRWTLTGAATFSVRAASQEPAA